MIILRKELVSVMKELREGIKGGASVMVSEANTAKTMGSGTLDVFATPALVALMERAAMESVLDAVGEGNGTVGTRMEADHVSATPMGMEVTCESELVRVEGSKLTFHIVASDACGKVGEAVHERVIIAEGRFMEKAAGKLDVAARI